MSSESQEELEAVQEALDLALMECRKRGIEFAKLEARYYSIKAQNVYALEADGKSATYIGMVIKGVPEVNKAMQAKAEAEVMYLNAREAINVYKKRLDALREQIEREWSRAGMSF